jgi:hypothetical protein
MEYDDYVQLLAAHEPDLAREVAAFNTLENVLAWMKERGLPLGIMDVITQDEFTHDVLVPLGSDGRTIVFGVT